MLQTTVGGVELSCCIYNASGPRTGSVEALSKLGKVNAGAILSKSATLVQQDGNELPRFINKIKLGDFCDGSINSEGLPNLGIDYYISEDAIKTLTSFGKPYIISLSGLSLQDNLKMITKVLLIKEVAAIELNLACPNIPGKPVIAYDFEQMEQVLQEITKIPTLKSKPFGIKLAPYFDLLHFERAASIIAKYPIQFVVTTNTMGNCLIVDYENECASIAPKGGLGGIGGGYIKPVALANVRTLSQKFAEHGRSDIDIVGVGGVATGRDAFELILCGARAVQVGTCHWTEGPVCFNRIAEELQAIMKNKGYTNIKDFCGKLKPYAKPTANATKKIMNDAKSSLTSDNVKTLSSSSSSSSSTNVLIYQSILVLLIAVIICLYFSKELWLHDLCHTVCDDSKK